MTASLLPLLDANREAMASDFADVIDAEVKKQSGLSGAAIKTAYSAAQKFKPGVVQVATNKMLPDFMSALSPLWDSKPAGTPFGAHLAANGDQAAEALLAVTDGQAQSAPSVLAKAYKSVRGKAKGHVIDALYPVGAVVEKYAG
ncbi:MULTISPECIES: DUF6918 family protein [Gordonia]|uniref:Uncharacterized protein n=1 Tax=Gordonia cholesterolivorans TaxID=559625 RepID=A0ABN3I2C7_9ACTN|nr:MULTISPECIES: hypothetical protein [Gordonia]KJR09200.1 hypothetical protein UG54_05390 [Gordonia sihwensis]KXT58909.1 hypothetical protein Y710_01285 [Gordonia sp. QH-12]